MLLFSNLFWNDIFLSTNNKDTGNKKSELISEVYEKDKRMYIINENYNAFYDPTGLQFSDE